MSCPGAELLSSLLAGDLPHEQSRELEDHVRSCDRCSEAIASRTRELQAASVGPASSPPLPRRLGPYRVAGLLGQGGMGIVYRAHHVETDRQVALKTVSTHNRWACAGLREEIAFLKNARHPGIVEILDYDLQGPEPWYAMEVLEGETLESRHREIWNVQRESVPLAVHAHSTDTTQSPPGPRPAAGGRLLEMLTLYARLCEPLAFAHREGIVHCDLKPANVLLRHGRDPVLVDFGLVSRARGAIGRETLHVAGRTGGTLPYLAPEVAHGHIPDARADLYSLGCMLYETLTGRPPSWALSYGPVRRLEDTPPRPSRLVADVPPVLDDLVMRLLAKRPQDRVNQAVDVASVLIALGAQVDAPMAPNGPVPAYLLRPRLVGRDAITSVVLGCCRRAHQGKGALVLVRGPSGIGKTFLASEISQRGALADLQVITGECLPGVSPRASAKEVTGGPMHPLRRLFAAIVDRCHELGEGETRRILGDHGRLLVPFDPALANLPGADRWTEPPPLPPGAARERLTLAVTDVLARVASSGPLLLTLDDLQWADDLSLAVLDALDEGFFDRTSLVILGTYRSDEAGDLLRRLASKPRTMSLELEALADDDVGQIVADMLAMSSPPESLVREISERSAGIPFFAAEYLRAMAAEGLLERGDGRWRLPPETDVGALLSAASFPTSMNEVMRRRLSVLSVSARAVMEAASVLGRAFEFDILEATAAPEDPCLPALREAVRRHVVTDHGGGRYEFLHDKIRETIYGELSGERRRALHAAAARALEARLRDDSATDRHFGELADHFRATGNTLRAIQYLERAGEHALRLSSDVDGARYFRDALELEATLRSRLPVEMRISWQRRIGEALQAVGRLAESVAPLTAAVSLAGYPMPEGKLALALGVLSQVAVQTANRAAPKWLAERRGVEARRALETGRAYDALQRAYLYSGQGPELIFANLRCLNVLERVERTPELAVAYGLCGVTAGFAHASLGQAYYRLALGAIGKCKDVSAESHIHLLLALHHMAVGATGTAMRHGELAVSLADQAGYFRRRDECLAVRGAVDILAGRPRAPLPWLDRLASSALRRQDRHMLSWSRFQRTQCMLLRGDFAGAQEVLDSVAAYVPDLQRPDQAWFLSLQASASLLAGREDGAREASDRGGELVAQGPPIHSYCIDAYARLAEVKVELWARTRRTSRGAADAKAAGAACDVVMACSRMFKVARPMAHLHRGTLHWIAGRRAKAISTWRAGLAVTRTMDVPILEARLAHALGRSSTSAECTALLARSRKLFADLGVPEPGAYVSAPAEWTS